MAGSFTCHCGYTGVERTPRVSQHTKLTLEKKILPPLPPRFQLATFQSRVWCFYQQAIPAPVVLVAGYLVSIRLQNGFCCCRRWWWWSKRPLSRRREARTNRDYITNDSSTGWCQISLISASLLFLCVMQDHCRVKTEI